VTIADQLPAAPLPHDPFDLPSAGRPIPWDDTLAAVLGYARAVQALDLRRQGSLAAETVHVRAFAYRAYDCVPPACEEGFAWLDVLVVDSLNGKLSHPIIAALEDAGRRAWPHVARAIEQSNGTPFWELPAEQVARRPTPGTAGESMNWAWEECMRTPKVKVALTHKLLHHKRPDLFPLIDGKTKPLLDAHADEITGMWGVVHRELIRTSAQFSAREKTFAHLVDGEGDAPLTRLRLHDILLWLKATENWDYALSRGRETGEWRSYAG